MKSAEGKILEFEQDEDVKPVKERKEPKESKKQPPLKKISAVKKLDPETAKLLQAMKEKANKKTFGRKVRDSEVIGKALALLKSEHIEELQESTLSEKDRLNIAHEEYQKIHEKLSIDQFIGKLIRGEVKVGSF